MTPAEARFWGRVDKSGNCWLWTGNEMGKGYGGFHFKGETTGAHRVAYELVKGPIPDGLHIDHLCRNRRCVRPDHLQAVTPRENLIRGEGFVARQVRVTHCPAGHPYNDENTRWRGNKRSCIPCDRKHALERYYAAKGKTFALQVKHD